MNDDSAPAPTPTRDAVIVAGTAFSLASAAFALSVVVLIPVLGALMQVLNAPALLQPAVVLLGLFGLPVVAAVFERLVLPLGAE